MSEIFIDNKDSKDKKTILEGRAIDVGSGVSIEPDSFIDMLNVNRNDKSITRYKFEVEMMGATENILDNYIMYASNPQNCHIVKFTPSQAKTCQCNMNAVAWLMYGDVNLAWSILFLNDLVKHSADLTYELLVNVGVKGFTTEGIEALNNILGFKRTNEENAGNDQDKEPLFSMDSF